VTRKVHKLAKSSRRDPRTERNLRRRARRAHLEPTIPARHRVCPQCGAIPKNTKRWWWHRQHHSGKKIDLWPGVPMRP
jgi:hypothetical protein